MRTRNSFRRKVFTCKYIHIRACKANEIKVVQHTYHNVYTRKWMGVRDECIHEYIYTL